jgi:hypothetical protein
VKEFSNHAELAERQCCVIRQFRKHHPRVSRAAVDGAEFAGCEARAEGGENIISTATRDAAYIKNAGS